MLLDIDTGKALGSIAVEGEPHGLVFSPDGSRGYVVQRGLDQVAVVDTVSRQVIQSEYVGERPDMLAISPDGKRLYVTIRDGDKMLVLSTADRSTIAEVKTGDQRHGIDYRQ